MSPFKRLLCRYAASESLALQRVTSGTAAWNRVCLIRLRQTRSLVDLSPLGGIGYVNEPRERSGVADAAPSAVRGTAFGIFHFVTGIAVLLASLIAGVLWQAIGPAATFFGGATFTAIGLAGMLMFLGRQQR